MTTKTKIIVGIVIAAAASYAGYKMYQNYQVNKHFPKKTDETDEKSNFLSEDFKNSIRRTYKEVPVVGL